MQATMAHATRQYQAYTEAMAQQGLSRQLPPPRQWARDFSSNDYLGLSQHPQVVAAAQAAAAAYGVGATGSRLLSGNTSACMVLEQAIAHTYCTETALIGPTGYQTNATVLASLCDPRVLGSPPGIFFDKYNHASLYAAVRPYGAHVKRYHHGDWDHLAHLLARYAHRYTTRWIVSETVFGMEGDHAPLEALGALARQYDTGVYLDEAHGVGITGPQGYGLSTAYDWTGISCVIMGTFSKALGGLGAYVACSHTVARYLLHHCPGLIYTTALPPPVIAAAQAAWDLIPTLHDARVQLFAHAAACRSRLQAQGWDTRRSETPIIPLLGMPATQLRPLQSQLHTQGIGVSVVLPPTVPPRTARLRIALTTHHQTADWMALCDHLPILPRS